MLSSGQILDGKYQVIKTLGQGGMSTVYLCKNIRLDNLWAIKEVRKELKDQMDFLAEPNILKNLIHPGIPRVIDIFYEEDNLYMVEDYIQGETLEDFIKHKDTIETKEICKIAINICDIISYLHSFEPPIIYRDLKPSNIMVTPKHKVVLIDFGISRVYKHNNDKDTIYMGSKGYAAPEQYGSEQTCKQTDIYGLGAVIYFMLIKQAPLSLLEPLKDDSYTSKVSGVLKNIIQKCMQIDIKDRYISVEQLQKELYQLLNGEYSIGNMTTEAHEEGNHDKTLIMSKKDDNANQTKMINTDEVKDNSYKVHNAKKDKTNKIKSKKPLIARVASLLIAIGIALGAWYLMTDHSKMDQIADNSSNNQDINDTNKSDAQSKTPANKDNQSKENKSNIQQPLPKDLTIAGVINKNSQILLGNTASSKNEDKSKGNGKSKGKSKHNQEDNTGENTAISRIAFKLNPTAVSSKYNNNFIVRLDYVEIIGNNLIAYCYIENKTDKSMQIKYSGNTYITNDIGKYVEANSNLSTDLSNISPGAKIENVKIVFSNFNINTSQIILKTNVYAKDSSSGEELNLIVNVR